MKARMLLAGGMLALAACATASGSASVAVSCDDFRSQQAVSREVTVRAGGTFEVSLCSNPSTGYAWEETSTVDPAILQLVGHRPAAPTAGLVGSPVRSLGSLEVAFAG